MTLNDNDLLFSHNLFKKIVIPTLKKGATFWVVMDNLRYDQFRLLEPIINHCLFAYADVSSFA